MDQQTTQPNGQNSTPPTAMPIVDTKLAEQPSAPITQTPLNPTPPPQVSNTAGKNKRALMVAIGIVFLIIILAASAVYVTGVLNRAKKITTTPPNQETVQTPTTSVIPQEPAEETETEAELVDTGDPASDITELEQDSSSL